MSFVSVAFASLTIICLGGADSNLNNVLFSGEYEFVDLTYPFDNNTVYWPETRRFEFTKSKEEFGEDGSWYSAKEFAAGEHGGTHLDAPYHFNAKGAQVGQIALEKLIVPMIIVDISSLVNDDPNFILYEHHLDYLLNDNFGKPCLLIFKFGWSKYFNDTKKYLGINEERGTLNFPGLSAEIAEWITSTYKNVVGIGVDTASVDPGSSIEFPVHKINSMNGLYHLENVKLDRPVPEYGCTALVMPMKIREGTGAPARVVAICPKTSTKFY